MKRLLGGAGAALGLKLVTGLAVAASAAVLAGAATEVAVTRSVNPASWGQGVTQAVETCKDTLRASGTRGIGPCVSAIANQRGEQAGEGQKPVNAAENNGKDKTKGNGTSNGNGNGNGNEDGNGNSHGNGNGNPKKPLGSPPTGGTDHPGPPPVPAN